MGNGIIKAPPQTATTTREVRPVHGIFVNGKLVDYALAPMDVAREKELLGGGETPLREKDSGLTSDFVNPEPGGGALQHQFFWGDMEASSLSDAELYEIVRRRAAISRDFAAMVGLTHEAERATRQASLPLPETAPRLWADRPADERGMNAAAWIRKVYAPWLGQGLARHHVGELDPELGRAYSGWTRKERHPEDAIAEFAGGNPYGRLDDAEALRRHRASGIESKARSRAAAKMPQP